MKALTGIILFFCSHALTYGFKIESKVPQRGRIVGGSVTVAPYQVSLLYRGYHKCGGSIISTEHILTASHCTYKHEASDLSVRVGSQILGSGGKVISVEANINHPRYDSNTFEFDFALLKLVEAIVLNGVTTAIIPLSAFNDPIEDNTPVLVTGWGSTLKASESNSVLRGVIVETMNQKTCNQRYLYDGGITEDMLCAGSPGKDSCNGDSGGPCKRIKDGELVALVSFGMNCADSYYPGVYARVAIARTWITENSGV